MLKLVLFGNGVINLLVGLMLIGFPAVGLRLPCFENIGSDTAFAAGGWGVALLALGVGRIWAALAPALHRMMAVVGVVEGATLAVYCVLRVALGPSSVSQVFFPLLVASIFTVLYGLTIPERRTESESLRPVREPASE